MARVLLFTVLGLMLVGSIWWATAIWGSYDTELSTDGTIALWLGIIVSLVVGIGLMTLVFLSSRGGHDEAVRYENLHDYHKDDKTDV